MIEELEQTHQRAEQDLLRAREFLDSIIENIPIAVFAKDAKDSRYVLLNRAGEEYYGMPREEMLGSVPAMLGLGAITAVEKNMPWGRRLTRPMGVVLVLAGVYALTP